jgi:predicted nucleotidyltransferase
MVQPQFDYERALRTLAGAGVEFIIVGGVASALNGAIHATLDLDIVPSHEPANLEKLLGVLEAIDAIYRIQPHRRWRPNMSHLVSPGHQNLLTDCGPLDVLGTIGPGLAYADLLPHTIEVEIDGYRHRVLGLAKIIEIKEQLRRDKDLAALPILRQTLKEKERGSS